MPVCYGALALEIWKTARLFMLTSLLFAALPVGRTQAELLQRDTGDGEILIIYREPQTESRDAEDAREPQSPPYVVEVNDETWRAFVGGCLGEVVADRSVERLLPGKADDLPPVHYHPKYFDVAKDYQGPLIDGGLTVLVAHHPGTRKIVRISAVLPSGTPTIAYSGSAITYYYQDRRVIFAFEPSGCCCVKVVRKNGVGPRMQLQSFKSRVRNAGSRVRQKAHQVPLTESVRTNVRLVRETAVGAVGTAVTLASSWVDKVGQAAEALPGVKTLRSAGQKSSQGAGQIEQDRQEGLEARRETQEFVRTVR